MAFGGEITSKLCRWQQPKCDTRWGAGGENYIGNWNSESAYIIWRKPHKSKSWQVSV